MGDIVNMGFRPSSPPSPPRGGRAPSLFCSCRKVKRKDTPERGIAISPSRGSPLETLTAAAPSHGLLPNGSQRETARRCAFAPKRAAYVSCP